MKDRKETRIGIGVAAGSFLLYVVMLLGVFSRSLGFTDEADNFIGGMIVASGGSIYKDFASQHMPVMYYICAILKLLGADTVYRFRLYFYIVMALGWTLVAVRYRKRLGNIIAVGCGAAYIVNLFSTYTCCVLAEQMQSLGSVILFLELLLFAEDKKLTWKNSVMISLAVFLSFGSAFVSAFTVFAAVVAFIYIGVRECLRQKSGLLQGTVTLVQMFWKTALWVVAPFGIMLGIYGIKGTLGDFIYGAYVINREIYSEYLGGYGSSAWMGFVEPVMIYLQTLGTTLLETVTSFGITKEYWASIRWLICFGVNILFWISYAFREGWKGKKYIGEALLMAYFTMMCANRGIITEFHSLPYIAVTMAMALWLIQQYVSFVREKHLWKKPKHAVALVMIAGVVLLYSANYIAAYRSVMDLPQNLSVKQVENPEKMAYWIARLTKENETVLLTTVEPQLLVEADRLPFRTGISAPWMYLAFQQEELLHLQEQPPRVAVYQSDYNVWGNFMREYAPDVWGYMEEHYTQLDGEKFPQLYVRDDYLDEALKIYAKELMTIK